jgi:hypothetical protein
MGTFLSFSPRTQREMITHLSDRIPPHELLVRAPDEAVELVRKVFGGMWVSGPVGGLQEVC